MSGGDETVNRDFSFVYFIFFRKKVILLIVLTVIKYCSVEPFFLFGLEKEDILLTRIS